MPEGLECVADGTPVRRRQLCLPQVRWEVSCVKYGRSRQVTSACYGCQLRTAECHAHCEIHKAERAARAAQRAETREARIGGREIGEYNHEKQTRMYAKLRNKRCG